MAILSQECHLRGIYDPAKINCKFGQYKKEEVEVVTTTKNKKQKSRKSGKATNSKTVKDYGNDPFFVKKANESQKFLEKKGFPKLPVKKS